MTDTIGVIILVILISIIIIFFVVEISRKPTHKTKSKQKYSSRNYYANFMGHTPSNILSVSSTG